ncbi:MAG: hypothetical protein JWN86_2934 [Planctomycetota bacterium]|nr:hypothetical protein [Planctomycetota bacterium]
MEIRVMSIREPDSREVARVEALSTVDGGDPEIDAFLDRCVPGSTWTARIRTAEVSATVLSRAPLGTFSERVCTCVRLRLSRAVPVEPGLRFEIVANDDSGLTAKCLVRPWGG